LVGVHGRSQPAASDRTRRQQTGRRSAGRKYLRNLLRRGGYVFISVSLFVCLLAGLRKTTRPIFTKCDEKIRFLVVHVTLMLV